MMYSESTRLMPPTSSDENLILIIAPFHQCVRARKQLHILRGNIFARLGHGLKTTQNVA